MAEAGQALDWCGSIEHENNFTLIPAGTYDFTITALEKSYFNGSTKLGPCPMAIVSCLISAPEGTVTLKRNLYLNTTTEGLLCKFFTSIGQRQHGEQYVMDWDNVVGRSGRCKVTIEDWVGKNGDDMHNNQIDEFLEPVAMDNTTAPKAAF